MVSLDHNTLGYLTFAFMSLAMLSGAFILISKRRASWVKVHVVVSIIAYILMFLTIWLVR